MNPNRKYGEGTLKADGETFGMTKISYSLKPTMVKVMKPRPKVAMSRGR